MVPGDRPNRCVGITAWDPLPPLRLTTWPRAETHLEILTGIQRDRHLARRRGGCGLLWPLPVPPHFFSLWPPDSLTHPWLTPRPAHLHSLTPLQGARWEGVHLPEAPRLSQVLGLQTCEGILTGPGLSGLHLSEPRSLHLGSGDEARTCHV